MTVSIVVKPRKSKGTGNPVGRPRKDGQPAGSVPRPESAPRVRKDGRPWGSGGGARKAVTVSVRLQSTPVVPEVAPDNSEPAQNNVGPFTVTVTAATSQAATAEARKLLGGPVRMINNDNGVRTYTSREI